LSEQDNNNVDRDFTRIPKNVAIEIKKLEYPVNNKTGEKSQTKNIAQQGACFTTATLYQPGQMLSLNIKLKGWNRHRAGLSAILNDELSKTNTLTALAEVVWAKESTFDDGYDIGVKFINVYEDDIVALQKYFTAILPDK